MRPFAKISSCLLLLVFLFSAAPKELVHDLFHGHESIDILCQNEKEDNLSILHNHCDLLQLTNPPVYSSAMSFSFISNVLLFILKSAVIQDYLYCSSPFLFFRGPPKSS